MMASDEDGGVTIMMNGLPGAMGKEVAAACLRRGFALAPVALTGPGMPGTVTVDDGEGGPPVEVELLPGPTDTGVADVADQRVAEVQAAAKADGRTLVAIDYTHPSAVNNNAALYVRLGLPFVMGTTGGDRAKLEEDVRSNKDPAFAAVIAPNMGKQIVALQAMLEQMAENFPASFKGYNLRITESHQSTKADTSGTAKAIAATLSTLVDGPEASYDTEDIVRVRETSEQLTGAPNESPSLNPVPEASLNGHAFHTYSLVSDDGSVEFQFRHNVCGRRMYAEGTADAVAYLAKQLQGRASSATDDAPVIYSMVDVLNAGAL